MCYVNAYQCCTYVCDACQLLNPGGMAPAKGLLILPPPGKIPPLPTKFLFSHQKSIPLAK